MVAFLAFMVSPLIVQIVLELLSGGKVNENEKLKNIYLIVCGIIMTLMIGLRSKYNGSGDTALYYSLYEKMNTVPIQNLADYIKNTDMEIGYLLTTWGLSKIFVGGQWLFVLTGAFFSLSVCRFVKKNCDNVVIALTVFNCLGLFNFMVQGLRQAIAMCICLWALELCKNKKLFRFLLTIAIAATFHASAVVFVPIYALRFMKVNIKSIVVLTISAVAVLFLLPQIFEVLNLLLEDDYEISTGSSEGGWIAIAIYIVVIVFGFIFKDEDNPNYPIYLFMMIIASICMLLRQSIIGIAERISFYFAFAQMAVVSNALHNIKDEKIRILISFLILVLCFGVAMHKASYSSLVPYEFFWQI